jgi:hypothetical protein
VTIIPRKNQVFHTVDAIIHHNYDGFAGYPVDQVKAAYRADNAVDGYGVNIVLQPSPVDQDFGVANIFLTENDVCIVVDAFVRSDELTQKLLGRGWTRPRAENEELVIKVVLRLIEVSPDFGIRLARRVESSTKWLAKLLKEHATVNGRLLRICQS